MANYSKARETISQARILLKQFALRSPAAQAEGENFPPRLVYNRIKKLEGLLGEVGTNPPATLRDPDVVLAAANALLENLKQDTPIETISSARLQQITNLVSEVEYRVTGVMPIHAMLADEIRFVVRSISDSTDANEKAKLIDAFAEKLVVRMTGLESSISAAAKRAEEILGHERQSSTAKQNAEPSAAEAIAQLNASKGIVTELAEGAKRKSELIAEIEKSRTEISSLLKNAIQVGLARSFQLRREDLWWSLLRWGGVFVLGTGALAVLGFYEVYGASVPLTFNADWGSLLAIMGRLLIASPLIWLTWFAAKQYGHAVRIREDYAFKEASAMAFVGYRDEMAADPEMVKLL